MDNSTLDTGDWLNLISVVWFLVCWIGYSQFAKTMAKKTYCLASVLQVYRIDWMQRLLARDNRVADASLIANLERNVTFFASTSMLILAGIVTVLTTTGSAFTVLEHLPFAVVTSSVELQLKLLVLIGIFVYAFFTFTWSMRQYGFCSILLGSAPLLDDQHVSDAERKNFARYAAKVIDQAAHSYNYGLRSYYFAMAVLGWFVSPWLFMLAVTLVVAVLYRREFYSKPLQFMLGIQAPDLGERAQ